MAHSIMGWCRNSTGRSVAKQNPTAAVLIATHTYSERGSTDDSKTSVFSCVDGTAIADAWLRRCLRPMATLRTKAICGAPDSIVKSRARIVAAQNACTSITLMAIIATMIHQTSGLCARVAISSCTGRMGSGINRGDVQSERKRWNSCWLFARRRSLQLQTQNSLNDWKPRYSISGRATTSKRNSRSRSALRRLADGMVLADRVDLLRLLGNGVVIQQAEHAYRVLRSRLMA